MIYFYINNYKPTLYLFLFTQFFYYIFKYYSKEAQKCYCEAPNCRGWIGETPEEEKEKIEKIEEKRERDTKKKKEEKKPADYMEDEDVSVVQLIIL